MSRKRLYVRGSVADRLAAHSAPAPNGCRLWTGTVNSKGYGQLNVDGRRVGVHRLAYEQAIGPIPPGMLVMHRCDTPGCIAPSHLTIGSPADNMADKVAKGRQQRGERVPSAKLTAERVEAIRGDRRPQRVVAAEHGVSRGTVYDIKHGRTWRQA